MTANSDNIALLNELSSKLESQDIQNFSESNGSASSVDLPEIVVVPRRQTKSNEDTELQTVSLQTKCAADGDIVIVPKPQEITIKLQPHQIHLVDDAVDFSSEPETDTISQTETCEAACDSNDSPSGSLPESAAESDYQFVDTLKFSQFVSVTDIDHTALASPSTLSDSTFTETESIEIDSTESIVDDPLYGEALQIVRREERCSLSLLQTELGVGYARASAFREAMQQRGILTSDGKVADSSEKEVTTPSLTIHEAPTEEITTSETDEASVFAVREVDFDESDKADAEANVEAQSEAQSEADTTSNDESLEAQTESPSEISASESTATFASQTIESAIESANEEMECAAIGMGLLAGELPVVGSKKDYRRITKRLLRQTTTRPACLMLTGAETEIDTTESALAIAQLIAQEQKCKTLLVDANFVSKSLTKMTLGTDKPGISEVVVGTTTLREVVARTDIENLFIVGCGQSKISENDQLQQALGESKEMMKNDFDLIIIDGGTGSTALTQSWGRCIEACYLVVAMNASETNATEETVKSLQHAGVPLMGCIVTNDVAG